MFNSSGFYQFLSFFLLTEILEVSVHYEGPPSPSSDFLVLNITEEFSALYKSTECICISSSAHIIFKVKHYIDGKCRWKEE